MPPKEKKEYKKEIGPSGVEFSPSGSMFDLNKTIDERALKIVREYLKTSAFIDRKLTDTPTDANQVVNRKYVTLNGVSANRPISSVVGQSYFDTSLATGNGKPIWWNGTAFVDAAGTIV